MSGIDQIAAARARWKLCQEISDYARARELDTTPPRVNRQLLIWERWYRGGLATGYLMRQTGVRFISQEANTVHDTSMDV